MILKKLQTKYAPWLKPNHRKSGVAVAEGSEQTEAPPRALQPFRPDAQGIQTFLSHRAGIRLRFPDAASDTVDRAWVHAALDYAFTPLPPTPAGNKPFIAVFSHMAGGFGDLLFGAKTTRLLTRALPQAKLAFLVDKPPDTPDLALEQEYGIEVFNKLEDLTQKHGNPDVVVVGPTASGAERDLPDSVDVVRVSEYGRSLFQTRVWKIPQGQQKIDRGITSGLGEGESGILVDPELVAWNEHTDRASAWANLDAPLRHGLLQGRNIEQFEDNAGMYFAYCNRSQDAALMALITASAQLPKQEINLVLAGAPARWRRALSKNLVELAKTHKDIQFHALRPSDRVAPLDIPDSFTLQGDRTLRIFTDSRMPHKSFVATMSLSQPLRVLTGDQSLTEGISLRSTLPLYEMLSWKQESYKGIIQQARDDNFSDLAQFLQAVQCPTESWETLAKQANNHQLLSSTRAFQANICQNHNLVHRLTGAVKAALYARTNPALAALQVGLFKDAENQTVSSHRVADALNQLQGLVTVSHSATT